MGERKPLDAYYTPEADARACVATLDLRHVRTVLEPSVGAGAWVRAVRDVSDVLMVSGKRAHPIHITGLDLDPQAAGLAMQQEPGAPLNVACNEAMETIYMAAALGGQRWDLVIGNPPYSDAQEHVEMALEMGQSVAFLLRLAFLESAKRQAFWREFPAASIGTLVSRPSFTGNGKSDSAAYAFFLWHRGYRGPTIHQHIDNTEKP